MITINRVFSALAALGCGLAVLTAEVQAQQRIGEAASVQNRVVRVNAGRSVGLSTGGSVFRDETVQTGRAGSAKLVFLDQTNLAIGPRSRVVLDRFIFAGRGTTQALSVNLARGAFRFTTGVLDKRAYKINTPAATIGVRGTVLDILARRVRSIITLVDDGAALVCVRAARAVARCIELTSPGDSVAVTRNTIRRITSSRAKFSFASVCASNPGLCTATKIASAAPASPGLGDALCGR